MNTGTLKIIEIFRQTLERPPKQKESPNLRPTLERPPKKTSKLSLLTTKIHHSKMLASHLSPIDFDLLHEI
jgi:hypothetical protein